MRFFRTRLLLFVALLCLGACGRGKSPAEGAVRAADTLSFARNLRIEYFDDYVSVKIRDPWDTLRQRQHYVLIDRDKPRPAQLPSDGIVIPVPVERAVIYTSVHTAIAEQLGALDRVAGVCEPEYITSPVVLDRIAQGRIADLGVSTSPNVEKIVDLDCDLIIASPFENSGYGSAEKLGIPIVEAADYMENHPLGRTEWVLFYGLLLGTRILAFQALATMYQVLNVQMQLLHIERLRQECISPTLKTLQTVTHIGLGGQHDDGNITDIDIGLNHTQHGKTIHLGHHHIRKY